MYFLVIRKCTLYFKYHHIAYKIRGECESRSLRDVLDTTLYDTVCQ
jgi:hypothetical protein